MGKVRAAPKPARPRHFIREWRKFRGLSQEQLAERIGVTHGAISQLETGKVSYTQAMLEALADAMMCEPGDLVVRDPTQTASVWSLWERALPGERERIIEFMEFTIRKAS
jgi:transcriptional regulator with XRE-family HTH domain